LHRGRVAAAEEQVLVRADREPGGGRRIAIVMCPWAVSFASQIAGESINGRSARWRATFLQRAPL